MTVQDSPLPPRHTRHGRRKQKKKKINWNLVLIRSLLILFLLLILLVFSYHYWSPQVTLLKKTLFLSSEAYNQSP